MVCIIELNDILFKNKMCLFCFPFLTQHFFDNIVLNFSHFATCRGQPRSQGRHGGVPEVGDGIARRCFMEGGGVGVARRCLVAADHARRCFIARSFFLKLYWHQNFFSMPLELMRTLLAPNLYT